MLFSQKIFADLSSLLTFQFDGASSTQRTHADREREPADVTRPCSDIERSPGPAERCSLLPHFDTLAILP
jgi:hypothetical protein